MRGDVSQDDCRITFVLSLLTPFVCFRVQCDLDVIVMEASAVGCSACVEQVQGKTSSVPQD